MFPIQKLLPQAAAFMSSNPCLKNSAHLEENRCDLHIPGSSLRGSSLVQVTPRVLPLFIQFGQAELSFILLILGTIFSSFLPDF